MLIGKKIAYDNMKHSLVFCKACGSLLDPPSGSEDCVRCHCCECIVKASEFEKLRVETKSKGEAFPHRPKIEMALSNYHLKDGATIKEKCPKCDANEMVFRIYIF